MFPLWKSWGLRERKAAGKKGDGWATSGWRVTGGNSVNYHGSLSLLLLTTFMSVKKWNTGKSKNTLKVSCKLTHNETYTHTSALASRFFYDWVFEQYEIFWHSKRATGFQRAGVPEFALQSQCWMFCWPPNLTHLPFAKLCLCTKKKQNKQPRHLRRCGTSRREPKQRNQIWWRAGWERESLWDPPEGRKILPRSGEMISRGNNLQTNTTYSDVCAVRYSPPPPAPSSSHLPTDIRFLI